MDILTMSSTKWLPVFE